MLLHIAINYIKTSDKGKTWSSDFNSKITKSTAQYSLFSKITGYDNYLILNDGYNKNVYLSEDRGSTWKNITLNENINTTYSSQIINNKIFIGTDKGIISSPIDNVDWSLANEFKSVRNFSISNNKFYAIANQTTIIESSDMGETWNVIDTKIGLANLFHISVNKDLFVVSTIDSTLYISRKAGFSWTTIPNMRVNNIETNDNYTLIATKDRGILTSKDLSKTWIENNENLPTLDVSNYTIKGDDVYISCINYGIYKNKLSIIDSIAPIKDIETLPTYFYSYAPYPQPATNEVRAEIYRENTYNIDDATISIYDISGNKIEGKENIEIIKSLPYNGYLKWNCSKTNEGVYIISIKHVNNTNTIKVIKKIFNLN